MSHFGLSGNACRCCCSSKRFADEPLPCCPLSTSSSSLSAQSSRHHPVLPVMSTHYTPFVFLATNQASSLRDQLLAFVTSGKETRIDFTPDARHFIVDMGASITITNAVTDFDHSPQPVKPTQLKGIASGTRPGTGNLPCYCRFF
jgi:hypothetical protein